MTNMPTQSPYKEIAENLEQAPIIIETDEPVIVVQPKALPFPPEENDNEEKKAL